MKYFNGLSFAFIQQAKVAGTIRSESDVTAQVMGKIEMLTFLLSYGHDYLVAHSTLNGSMYNAFVHATKHYITNKLYIDTLKKPKMLWKVSG